MWCGFCNYPQKGADDTDRVLKKKKFQRKKVEHPF